MLGVSQDGPPHQPKPAENSDKNSRKQGAHLKDGGVEYQRYLEEVHEVLRSDPEFMQKIKDVDVKKLKDGSIADELMVTNYNLRTKLDNVKRKEIDRLRKLARGIDRKNLKLPAHVDATYHKFEVGDLKKLIKAATSDME